MRCAHPLVLALLMMGCGGATDAPAPSEGEGQGDALATTEADASSEARSENTDAPAAPAELPCPTGQVPGADGACMPVGIQGCAEIFIDPDTGLCKPSMDDCPLGQIPIFSEGCQPVGIPGCAEIFIDSESGLCNPKPEHCPPGQIPIFSEGCQPVGVTECHPDFIDVDSGLCIPRSEDCPEHHIAVPTQGCVSLDPPEGCGEGTWGAITLTEGDVHVDASAEPLGDGTREAPLTTLAQAYAQVADGGRIVIAAGDYPEGLMLTKAVSLIGRCSSMVTISGLKPSPYNFSAVLQVRNGVQASISDLTLSGAGVGLNAVSQTKVDMHRVVIQGAHGVGLLVAGAGTSLSASTIEITQTVPKSASGTSGRGIEAQGGGAIMIEGAELSDNQGFSIYSNDSGSSLTLNDALVTRTLLKTNMETGVAVRVRDAGTLMMSKAVVSHTQGRPLSAFEFGTRVTLNESVLIGAQTEPDGTGGTGVTVGNGCTSLVMERTAVVDVFNEGVLAWRVDPSLPAPTLAISRSLISNVEAGSALTPAKGLTADGTNVTLEHTTIKDNQGFGVLAIANSAETVLSATETLIAQTRSDLLGNWGSGLHAHSGAKVTLTRSSLTENRASTVFAARPLTHITLRDSIVSDTFGGDTQLGGRGIELRRDAQVTLERAAIVHHTGVGITANGEGTTLDIQRSLISDIVPPESEETFSRGVHAQVGVEVTMRQSACVNTYEAGVSLTSGAQGVLEDVLVSDVRAKDQRGIGDGLFVLDADAVMTNVVVRDNARAGLLVSTSSGALQSSVLTGNAVGLVRQGETPDLSFDVLDSSLIEGNAQDVLSDDSLAVAEARMETPELPQVD